MTKPYLIPTTTFSGVTTARDNKSQLQNVRLYWLLDFAFLSPVTGNQQLKEAGYTLSQLSTTLN